MSKMPNGNTNNPITITCTEKQRKYIVDWGCIACNDDICDCDYCGKCVYDTDNIIFHIMEDNE